MVDRTIIRSSGPKSYKIELSDGRIKRRHVISEKPPFSLTLKLTWMIGQIYYQLEALHQQSSLCQIHLLGTQIHQLNMPHRYYVIQIDMSDYGRTPTA